MERKRPAFDTKENKFEVVGTREEDRGSRGIRNFFSPGERKKKENRRKGTENERCIRENDRETGRRKNGGTQTPPASKMCERMRSWRKN